MLGLTGYYQHLSKIPFTKEEGQTLLSKMAAPLLHTKKQSFRMVQTPQFAMAQIGTTPCPAPFQITQSDRSCYLALDGNLYNLPELKQLLSEKCHLPLETLKNASQEEVLLWGFMKLGLEFIRHTNGHYSMAIYDARHNTLFLARDPFGTKPLFYTEYDGRIGFASEIKSLLPFRPLPLRITREGLNEIFSLGPARTPGNAVFADYHEVKPGCLLSINAYGICSVPYYTLPCYEHLESYEETVQHTRDLLEQAVTRQLPKNQTYGCLLSGGIDSSLIAALLNRKMQETSTSPNKLTTISFDFKQNNQFFHGSRFQPSQDRPYVELMLQHIKSEHYFLECSYEILVQYLGKSLQAHDLPNMADIDASLLYFCQECEQLVSVVYTGECADEVFCGYPWMHRDVPFSKDTFPWSRELSPRQMLLQDSFVKRLGMEEYVRETYHTALKKIPICSQDSLEETEKRRYGALNLYWFMQTLLNRMDRCARSTGLETRIPFADTELISYIYQVPFAMKARNGMVKALLRQASVDLLPQNILLRKKSPFPKTYHPAYEQLLAQMLRKRLQDPNCPLLLFLDPNRLFDFLNRPMDYAAPWYGQLMCGPQLIAYYLQIDQWIRDYSIAIDLH